MRKANIAIAIGAGVLAVTGAVVAPVLADSATPAGSAVSPQLTVSPMEFQLGQSIDSVPAANAGGCEGQTGWNYAIPMTFSWQAQSGSRPVKKYDLIGWNAIDAPYPILKSTARTTYSFSGGDYTDECGGEDQTPTFQVVAHTDTSNAFGGDAASVVAGNGYVDVWQEDGRSVSDGDVSGFTVTKTGSWQTANCSCFNWGQTAYTSQKGASIVLSFTTKDPGQYIGLVMPESNSRGKFTISVDGKSSQTVDTYASAPHNATIVWQSVLVSPGKHTVVIKNLATAGRPRIDLDSELIALGSTCGC